MNGVGKFMGVNIDLSISVQPEEQALPPAPRQPPPLDLLPCPPPKTGFLWQSLFHRSSSEPSPRLGIDVNQVPSPQDDEDETSSLQLMTNNAAAAAKMSHSNNSSYPAAAAAAAAKRERDVEDKCEITSSRASDEEEGTTRKKLRLSKDQSALLEESFREHSTLNPKQKTALAKQLNLRPRQVEVWFQNRRARTKLKQTEVDCELLKRCCEGLTEENRRLQKELQELRALKVAPPCVITHDFYMPLPATTLTMCPSCERLATVDNTANTNASTNTNNSIHTNNNMNHFRGFLSNTANAKLIKPFPHQQKLIRTELMN